MKKSGKIIRGLISVTVAVVMLFVSPQRVIYAAESGDKITVSLIGKYDSADTAAIRDIDTVKRLIRFRNHATGKTYTLSYDNTSMMYDARGTVLSASLLEVGQIVDVTFLKSTKHITTLNISNDAWVVEDTRSHELVRGDGTAKIKGDIYKIDPRTLVIADGQLALAEDVLSTDRITVRGVDKEIYSVVVTGGHGYVSLSSETVEDHSLVGSWIELDNEVIYKISPGMLLSAPEGDYNLQILGNGASYQSEVSINRNQETVVDTSSVTITKPKEGLVTFDVIPDTAEVLVDGEKVLTGTPQSIRYGYHSLKIRAEGYKTQDKYLKIGTPKSIISIELEKDEDASVQASSESSDSSGSAIPSASSQSSSIGVDIADISSIVNSAATTASTVSANSSSQTQVANKIIEGYKIYFDKPYGAELYFDGSYVGMIPASVTKISGTHEVILKQEGYETKSYRISIDSDLVDLNYTFPDLVKIEKEDVSGNSSDAAIASSSASTADSSQAASSASTGDSSSSSSLASTGDSSSGSSSASTGDSSSGSSSAASTGTSSSGSSSASTGDSSSGSSSAASTGTSASGSSSAASTGDTPSSSSSAATSAQSPQGSSQAPAADTSSQQGASSAADSEAESPSLPPADSTDTTSSQQAEQETTQTPSDSGQAQTATGAGTEEETPPANTGAQDAGESETASDAASTASGG